MSNRITMRTPCHVLAGGEKQSKAVVSRDSIRQTDWNHRQGARGAMLVTEALDSVPITAAITGRLQPGGSLLLEVQGQSDLAMAERQAAKLAGTMDKAKGASQRTSYATVCEGVSAGIAALTAWHNGQAVEGGEGQTGLVCWRAVESSMSADTLGDTVTLSEFTPDSLAASMLPLPQLLGDDSREDKASRLLFERARSKRPALLSKRIAAIQAMGGRGKRKELVERVGRACRLILQGEPLDKAAELAGFKAGENKGGKGGKNRAGDQLARAVRRLGFKFLFTLREHERREAVRRASFVPMSKRTAAQLSLTPSESIPLQSGRGGKQWVTRLQITKRHTRKASARQARQARQAARDARQARQAARQAARDARQTRRIAQYGLWAGGQGNIPKYAKYEGLANGERRQWVAGRLIVG